ncbi:RNA polymerase sigma factor [Bacteroides helcogenes]|uniref:RNA polymerase, sigma-24 subunit, ECF subfamily n=1 Tax=Bacteroides helcogenes (strain ATCC 35417 / DSM 20613 / JCM 6297 / CCUG 15421 / P 36-108) TaxID=693979 RepID=E6SWA2_BACT6|nr:RNA polymerase, sigma-24 subunit, ECF subfamily [Bacteroides helcogenes P 36-108]
MEFEDIYKRYWNKIFRLCMGYVNDYALAQDMAQETFIKVWQCLPSFRHESNIDTWIFRIATNRCLRQLEREDKTLSVPFPVNLVEEDTPAMEPRIELLYKFISELPEIDRIIISLELEDVRQVDIARIVGLSEGNVRVRIHRIKLLLTRKFEEYGE